MAGPSIDVKANTGDVSAKFDSLSSDVEKLSRKMRELQKTTFNPISPSAHADLQRTINLVDQLAKKNAQLSGAQNISDAGAFIGSGGPHSTALPPAIAPVVTPPRAASTPHGRGRWSNYGSYGVGGRLANAFTSSMGGGAGVIAGEAMTGARSRGGFSAGGLARGGAIGAGLFAAYKGGQAAAEGYDLAKQQAIESDKLKRQMGDLGVSFNGLRVSADYAADGMQVNALESVKLMQQLNRSAGTRMGRGELAAGVRVGGGMGLAMGLDPSQGVGFIGAMRQIMRGGTGADDRRISLIVAETVNKSGMNARADEVLQSIQSFAAITARNSMTRPNVAGYAGMYAGMVGAGIPGMTGDVATSMMAQANQAMTGMGAFGEASQTFTLAALNRMGAANPIQAQVIAEGGLFGSRSQAFGKGSAYRRYMMQEGRSEEQINELIGERGNVTNMAAIREQLDRMRVAPELKAEMAKNYFGLSSISQAMAFMSVKPEQMGATEKLLGRAGVNLGDYAESGIMTLTGIAGAQSRAGMQPIIEDMLGRTGKGQLTKAERERIMLAQTEAAGMSEEEGLKLLQDVVTQVAATKDKQETTGSLIVDQTKRVEDAMIKVGQDLLGPLITMKEAALVAAGIGPMTVKERAYELEAGDIRGSFAAARSRLADTNPLTRERSFWDAPEQLTGEQMKAAQAQAVNIQRQQKFMEIEEQQQLADLESRRAAEQARYFNSMTGTPLPGGGGATGQTTTQNVNVVVEGTVAVQNGNTVTRVPLTATTTAGPPAPAGAR